MMLAVYHGLDDAPLWVWIAIAAIASIVLVGVIWCIAMVVRGTWRYFRERTNR